MQYRKISLTNAGRSAIITVDDFQTPFNIGLAANVTSGSPTFSIQFTLDDPNASGFTVATALWFAVPSMSGISADTAVALTIPCRAICIYMAEAQTGTVELTAVQAGPA